jgi:general secretion pathway protein K
MKQRKQDTGTSGFVLVNALVLVAAMSAAAVFLLARAEGGRMRLAAAQEATTLRHNLDAFEALGRAILDRDQIKGAVDSAQDTWARAVHDVALDRGSVSGQIMDQQAMFNINWMADPLNDTARDGFARLLTRIGVSPLIGDAIIAYVSSAGPGNRQTYRGLTPPVAPLGGSILMFDQLAALPEILPRDLAVLRTYVTVLPGASRVNVNTASEAVLSAVLPQLSTGRLRKILQRRADTPFASVDEFMTEMDLSTSLEEDPDAVDPARFSVGSDWFSADITATFGPRIATRQVMYRRAGTEEGTQVDWRVSRY